MANKAKSDSIKAIQMARRDSIQQKKKLREIKRKETERAKKKNKKKSSDEEYTQTEFTRSDSIREFKRDSLKAARLAETENRKRQQAQRQEILLSGRKKIILPLTQEMSGGFRLNSDGWTVFINRGFLNNEEHKTIFFSIDLSEKKHPKETRTSGTLIDTFSIKPIPYKYGKVNNFYQLKIGIGGSKELTGKLDKKSVIVNWVYNGGLSIGLLKPYYLDLWVPEGNSYVRKYEKYSEENKAYFLDLNNRQTILGGSSFTKGINEISIKPGIHLKSGFNFDYSASRKSFLGVEIGASAELYTTQIDIMTNTKNTAYFINFYADFRFGKRWE
jgi:hypothetical protein